jgi:integrase
MNLPDKEIISEDEDLIFLYEDRIYSNCEMWEMGNIYKAIANPPNYHFHQWRHTGIMEYAKVEKDIKKVQTQARHDDPITTMRYINYANQEYKQFYNAWADSYTKKVEVPVVDIRQVSTAQP